MVKDCPKETWPLKFWDSEDWFNVNTKLDFLEDDGIPYNPRRCDILKPLVRVPLSKCRVAIFGESPYPNEAHCTGVAFESGQGIPPSLRTIFAEWQLDLRMDGPPSSGDLRRWTERGVLLWNVTPTIEVERKQNPVRWETYTHEFWPEWQALTKEIVRKVSDHGEVAFVFFGNRAQQYARFVNTDNDVNAVSSMTHPSPRAQMKTQYPIVGSGLFTGINKYFRSIGREPIDWGLD